MRMLDKLRTVFEGKFETILSNNKITLFDFSKNTQEIFEIKEEGKLSIDIRKATLEQKKLIKKNVIDAIVQEKEGAFLGDDSSEKTKQIKRNLPKGAMGFY